MIDENITNSPVDATVLLREAAAEMRARLSWMTIKPEKMLLLENALTDTAEKLKACYPGASVLQTLPAEKQSVDLIFANLILPWQTDIPALLASWRQLLRKEGVMIISALGPDTLKACANHRWPAVVDMHNLGDGLLQAGFSDPVLDVDYYTMTYTCCKQLQNELLASNMLRNNDVLADALLSLGGIEGWSVTYEVIYAHAFAPDMNAETAKSPESEFKVSVADLRKQMNNRKVTA